MNEILTWGEAWQRVSFRVQLIGTFCFLFCIVIFVPHFLDFIQQRKGIVLNDPVLKWLAPHDLSFFTFFLIYSSTLAALISFLFYPRVLLYSLQAYVLLITMRMVCIWLVPLDEPPGFLTLNDPLIDVVGYAGEPITKDLFFSGHTSTLFLFFLSVQKRYLKLFLLVTSVTVAICVLIQHVHYTVDVVAAPLFSWVCYRICFRRKILRI